MKVLVINSGSSSLKYQLIDLDTDEVMIKGLVEKIGLEGPSHTFDRGHGKTTVNILAPDHKLALEAVLNTVVDTEQGPIASLDEIDAVGHRVVSGGEYFSASTLINDDVVEKIEICSELAPLHNPPALRGIYACRELMPEVPEVAVFDTAFFQTLPPRAYVYPLPYQYYTDYKIRKYGYHGISHRYVSHKAAELVGANVEDLKIITCHIGNGASIAAVDHGKAVDTTMGLTPLDGLMMGTRCGSIDPAVVTYLQTKLDLTPDEVNNIMNKESGLLGVSGISSDMRAIEEAAEGGDQQALLACEIYAYVIKRYIGQYLAVMGGADIILFTAGVGENSDFIRRTSLAGLEPLGIVLDQEKNLVRGEDRIISTDDSTVKIMVINTNEELMIARDVQTVVEG